LEHDPGLRGDAHERAEVEDALADEQGAERGLGEQLRQAGPRLARRAGGCDGGQVGGVSGFVSWLSEPLWGKDGRCVQSLSYCTTRWRACGPALPAPRPSPTGVGEGASEQRCCLFLPPVIGRELE